METVYIWVGDTCHTHTYTLTDNYGTVTVESGAGNKVTKAI